MPAHKNIKVAIAGVGNCASALVQGVEYTAIGTALHSKVLCAPPLAA